MRRSLSPALSLLVMAGALAATPRLAHAGPPWISIELPANPFDAASRGAFLLVHAFHHGQEVAFPLSGTAEGLVKGERRSIPLRFERTSRSGVYALKKQWGDEGEWTLVLTVSQGKDDVAQALVQISGGGETVSVKVPTRQEGNWTIPRRITVAEIEGSLRERAVMAHTGRTK